MTYSNTDAGRSDTGINEHNDCTVRAYAAVMNISYMQAHADLFVAGRRMRRGFKVVGFFNEKFGKPQPRPHMTVVNYVKYIAHTGKWIILIRGHVFAVINGVIHDINPTRNDNCYVVMAWRVE